MSGVQPDGARGSASAGENGAGKSDGFKAVVDGLPIGVVVVDEAGRIEYANARCTEFFGRELHGSLDTPEIEEVLHPEDAERAMSAWLAARSGGRPFEVYGVRLKRRDGAYRSHLGRGFPLRREPGEGTRWALCGIDMQRIQDAADAARERELVFKDAFLAMLGHELRNPLGPIRNAAQILGMTGSREPAGARALEIIERQVGQLAHLIDDLLDVSRIVAGKLELARERNDFAALVRQLVDEYRPSLEAAGLRLSAELAAGPVHVDGDPRRLQQIVSNLLHNARKFTPPGGTVTVRLAARDGRAVLSVVDTGVGMDAKVLQHAFEAFSQADRSLERTGGGLGLGLALVKGLVDLHGGEVRVTSAGPRKGSQVSVELPLDTRPAPGVASGAADQAGRKLRVLVIEDNLDAADSLQTLLRLAGHEVQTALSGPSGIAVADRFQPEVVLCDIGLPGMDGYAVARSLRSGPNTAGAHLVALTGYGQDEDRKRGQEAGFDDYLTKPADFRMLQEVMQRQPRRA